jgi:hypothetical protein
MLLKSRIVLLGCLALSPCGAQERAEVYRLDTADYRIEMTVRFFSPYLGRQLSFRSASNPTKLLCYSGNGDSSHCLEKFVGALAVVSYRFQARRKEVAASAAFREVVNVVAQSDRLNPRPPYVREVRLVKGEGTDIQAFGYDESSVPEAEREALRAEARSSIWVLYRQELFVNGDSQPFGVVEWKHTLNRIEVVRVGAPPPVGSTCSYPANWAGIAPRSCEEECRSSRLDSGVTPCSTRAGRQLLTPFLDVIP